MNEIEQAALSARIAVLEEMMAMLIVARLSPFGGGASDIDEFRTTMWNVGPKGAPDLPEDHPVTKAFRASWEKRLDSLLDRASALADETAKLSQSG